MTVAAVNSALQRARAALALRAPDEPAATSPMNELQQDLLARYVEAFEQHNVEALTALLRADVTMRVRGRDPGARARTRRGPNHDASPPTGPCSGRQAPAA